MPIEYCKLKNASPAKEKCQQCQYPFPQFMRGQVQSNWRRILGMKYCAVICDGCKEIIGWEKPI